METIPRGTLYWSVQDSFKNLIGSLSPDRWTVRQSHSFEQKLCAVFNTQQVALAARARVCFSVLVDNLGASPGQKIIMPPITIRPMLDIVIGKGLTPVFVDLDPESLLPSEAGLSDALEDGPSFCLFTPLFGLAGNLPKLIKMARSQGVPVITDISQCLHSTYGELALWEGSDYVFGSFSALKTVDTLGGGFLFTPRAKLPSQISAAVDGLPEQSRKILFFTGFRNLIYAVFATRFVTGLFLPWLAVIDVFLPGFALRMTGSRSRTVRPGLPDRLRRKFSPFQSRIGLRALEQAATVVEERKKNARLIRNSVRNDSALRIPREIDEAGSDFWQLLILVENPRAFQRHLWSRKIDCGATSLSLLPDCQGTWAQPMCPEARRIYNYSLFVPSFPGLRNPELQRILSAINSGEGRRK